MRADNIDSILLPHLVTFLELGTMLSGSQIASATYIPKAFTGYIASRQL